MPFLRTMPSTDLAVMTPYCANEGKCYEILST